MPDLVLKAKRSIALTLSPIREDRARIVDPAFGEIWMHRADETIDKAALVGTASPGQSLVFDYNPTQKTDLIFYLVPKDAVGKENVSRLSDAIKTTFSFEGSLTPESGTFAVTTEKNFYPVDCSGGNSTGNLPAAASCVDWEVTFKKTDSSANTLTLDGNSSETIDGATTYVISKQWESVTLKSDGSKWLII